MGALLQDARYAFRWLARNPGFAAATLVSLAAAAVPAYLPARRAARIDPCRALRQE